jgi:L-aminopeptidase/D-esterase-like protein
MRTRICSGLWTVASLVEHYGRRKIRMTGTNTLTDVPGIKVGHWTNLDAGTGCTVILCGQGAVAGVDVRGGAPGTRETDLLDPTCTVDRIHAILLGGGSAFGLAAADGVMQWLEEHGIGFDTGVARVPVVPAAILFDLGFRSPAIRPTAASGYAACEAATDDAVEQGNAGAGAGATCGKMRGPAFAMKAGLGSASIRIEGGVIVAAMVAVNALGDVVDWRSGRIVAGARSPRGKGFANEAGPSATLSSMPVRTPASNTTLAVVATNAALDKAMATKVAQMAQDGLARAIRPSHTQFDGDTVFALSVGEQTCDVSRLGAAAADMLADAVVNAVRAAEALGGLPAARNMEG